MSHLYPNHHDGYRRGHYYHYNDRHHEDYDLHRHHDNDYRYDDYHPRQDLAQHSYRDSSRQSSRPSRYIVNELEIIISRSTSGRGNTVFYNSPRSTIYVRPERSSSSWTPAYGGSSDEVWTSPVRYGYSSDSYNGSRTCRGCGRRELEGGFCRDCIEVRVSRPLVEIVRGYGRSTLSPRRRIVELR
ncbi:uncharacterized protein BCR38DRAFT_442523 [Pseudomassariella vexata]|uniref:Uncharacterized protein n=1 Tax=Pseudomassariella vexata TaxID=1141098 RepID=A0A1Y2DNE8_9PEZI|nr:uncharacterized protein BCR38DRAFT_442523 [Pseudomassariella vexata]ORY60791.1 hypothetical protein BCR38DRAFT_442523 [Pseudomassariella vexata]